ncbi:MAG: hypothetical protein KAT65_07325 [Methanophagales archaeon]|nr:hypothetical protein [Methanophagales archaeon]
MRKNEGLMTIVVVALVVIALMSVAMPAVGAGDGACDWTGTWDTSWGKMVLVQTGNQVTGTYEHDNGKIEGLVSGNTLTGTWSEAPSYSPPGDAGDFKFTISPGCNSFTGKWRYGSAGGWSSGWDGTRVSVAPTPTPTLTPTPAPTPGKFKKCTGDQPYLYVEDRVMGKGKTVEIPIMMCNAKELANMDLDWSYDAAVLKIIDVTKGSLNKKALFDWNEVSAGKLKISFASSKGVTGSGSIAVMKFEVIGKPGDTSTLTGTVTTASKTDGSKISVGVNPGKFTVGSSSVKGDCDGDGKLTVKDALAALQMSVEKRAVDMCYDYNDDGKVNSADAREMLKAIVGKK